MKKELVISMGESRKCIAWRAKVTTWEKLVMRLASTKRTRETVEQYGEMNKDNRSRVKDVGGFVGGTLRGPRRKKGYVESRSLITLDADHVEDIGAIVNKLNYESVIYSTHSHTEESPRLRVVIPLIKPIPAEQYEPVARMVAYELGIDNFDHTTYEAHRLMYWPSTCKDGEFFYQAIEGDWCDADEVLEAYEMLGLNPLDPMHWMRSDREQVKHQRDVKRAEDPTTKDGLIGAFCRSYDVHKAIETFIPDVYVTCDTDRYTYSEGSTAGGVVVYEGLYSYSHHETDPAGGRLCNAWDLVRLHKFGELDKDTPEGTRVTRLPSYHAMQELAQQDDKVKQDLMGNDDWVNGLALTRNGECRQTILNVKMVLDNDPQLKGCIRSNIFSNKIEMQGSLPWRKDNVDGEWSDADDAGLRLYLEQHYHITSPPKIYDGVQVVADAHRYHPVKDYLNGLTWDGEERLDRLLVDYLGAEDTEYVRTVTRKTLVAAVARIFNPGVKYDSMLVLVGKQGVGKSYILKKLAGDWHSDSLITVQGKEAFEQIQGAWVIEMAELSALRRAETEHIKHFLSKQEDVYRAAYGRRTQRYPRQCIIIGTTNEWEFLKDTTGNRRFLPVQVHGGGRVFMDLTDHIVDQLWAEARERYRGGEKLYLQGEVERKATEIQTEHLEADTRVGLIQKYLETGVPDNWQNLGIEARRRLVQGSEFGKDDRCKLRERVCAIEILCELFGRERGDVKRYESSDVNAILRSLPDWEDIGLKKFGVYGAQRGFGRV